MRSWTSLLKLLPNLSRLHITGPSTQEPIPAPIHAVIRSLKALTTLKVENLGLTHCARLVDWAPQVRVLEAQDCRGYNVIQFTEEGTPAGVLTAPLRKVVIERTASEEESRTRALVYTLAAAERTLEELEFRGRALIEAPFLHPLFTNIVRAFPILTVDFADQDRTSELHEPRSPEAEPHRARGRL